MQIMQSQILIPQTAALALSFQLTAHVIVLHVLVISLSYVSVQILEKSGQFCLAV